MENKKIKTGIILAIIFISFMAIFFIMKNNKKNEMKYSIIHPTRDSIKVSISTTGIVQPQNRLEIKPPINGRIDRILIQEGYRVRSGQILAWMSSEERAALIDAARSKGKKAVEYWQNTYKQIPLIAPINGTIIVRDIEPGQTVTTATAILVISDRLIVEADVDETDIGNIKKDQKATISLDAYPEVISKGKVDHISYESTTINNVTIYKVQILPEKVPEVYRSGMSANIEIIQKMKDNCLLVPYSAIKSDSKGQYLLVIGQNKRRKKPIKKYIKTGITDNNNIEVVEGISDNENIIEEVPEQFINGNESEKKSKNPFMPRRPRSKSKKGKS